MNFQQTPDTAFPTDVAAQVRADRAISAEVKGVGWQRRLCGDHRLRLAPAEALRYE
ncbi:MAG TPA: hypothetical protein VKF14_20495 [Candidatus Dormibacteraeota bacterium]|nr:hypothetical protein [Candidatus Dormibacteraeota bacterium]